MSWICVKAIRRWADEEIESTGRDVLRRQAHRLADDVNETLEEIHTSNETRHKKLTDIMADTARRNVRAEAEVKRLTEENADLKAHHKTDATDSHYCEYATAGHGCMAEDRHFQKTIRLEKENAELKENVAGLKRLLKPVLECWIQRVDGLDSPDGEFMTSSEYGVCDCDGNEVDTHSIAEALNAVRAAQRMSMSAAATDKDERGQSPK